MPWKRVLAITTAAILATTQLPAAALAQTLVVSTGVPQGTYSVMFQQLTGLCGPASGGAALLERTGSGSAESVARLGANEVHAAVVQEDVLYARQLVEDLRRLKSLFWMHPEEVHVIALRKPATEGGVLGLGARTVRLNTLADLAGRRVATWGGGLTTAQLIQAQGGLDYTITEVAGPDEAMAALHAHKVDAVLAVGGAPLPWVAKLDGRVQLLGATPALAQRLNKVYRSSRVSYPRLSANPVATLATQAVLVTQDYRSPAYRNALLNLRRCLREQTDTLRETAGFHPKWRDVDVDSVGSWPLYEAGTATAATTTNLVAPAAAASTLKPKRVAKVQ